MAIYTSNRDGGKTDEAGHLRFVGNAFEGNVVSGLTTKQNSPLGMSVLVEPGDFRVPYGGYAYTGWIDSNEAVTVDTANPSNPRIDRLVLYVDRSEPANPAVANNPGIAKLALVKGTADSSPNRPTTGAVNSSVNNNPWIDIADIRVNAGVTQITTANITDRRELYQVTTNTIANSAVTPEKRSGGFATGVIPASTFATTGNKTISGIGFKPKRVELIVLFSSTGSAASFASGMFDDNNQFVATSQVSSSGNARASSTSAVIGYISSTDGSWTMLASGASLDSDGFTLNVSTPNSLFDIAWCATA